MILSRLSVSALALAGALMATTASAQTLRIALADDPDALDPVTTAAQTAATVLYTMCERLMSTDTDLNILPGLAESWEWSESGTELTLNLVQGQVFHDGTPFNAEAVTAGIDRARAPGTQRSNDLNSITDVTVVDEYTVLITTAEPAAQLLSKLAGIGGVIFSPAQVEAMGADIGRAPVCVGPYRFANRVAQDSITLERDPGYRLASDFAFDSVIFRIIPDDSVRLANLQSGDVDVIEKLDPSHAGSLSDTSRYTILPNVSPNNQALMFNLDRPGPMQDPRVRRAFELGLDRQAIVDVAFAGQYLAANQFAAPGTVFYNEDNAMPARDPEAARALLEEAGVTLPVPFTILVPNRPLAVRVGEMMQAMTNEAGFATRLDVVDFATTLQLTNEGNFEAWGPIGPQYANDMDTLIYQVLHSSGGRNVGRYNSEEMDDLLNRTRSATDPDERRALFVEAAGVAATDIPVIYLYHQAQLYVMRADLTGVSQTGDGILQLGGAALN
ncbi:MAG: ABC transporter substrate-binding protein [Pararhodobacter sp.]